jgi:hypothetical protein
MKLLHVAGSGCGGSESCGHWAVAGQAGYEQERREGCEADGCCNVQFRALQGRGRCCHAPRAHAAPLPVSPHGENGAPFSLPGQRPASGALPAPALLEER